MSNEFRSFYLKEIQAKINEKAVEIMIQPQKLFLGDQAQKVESLSLLNDRISHFNDGVRSLAIVLINAFEKDGEECE